MIDLKAFRTNPQPFIDGLNRRGLDGHKIHASIANQDQRIQQSQLEELQHTINEASKKIPLLEDREKAALIKSMKSVSNQIAEIKSQQKSNPSRPLDIPNIPRPDVPDGTSEKENRVEREVGKKPNLEQPQEYLALAEKLGLIDMGRGSKVSGSRFGYLLGPLAQMEFALVHYAMQTILPSGFTMIVPPVMIKEENMAAMGYLAGGGEEETYHFQKDGLYLVGTSEQSIGPMLRDEVLAANELPKRYLSFSTCFRREAGSYGKDTKGIIRVHQFDKLEMFSFCSPESSDQEHEFLLSLEEKLMQGLKLPYRVVKLCAGDLGYPSARTYDIETWMPGQGVYRETHSTSTTTDYQSRDLNIKVKGNDGAKEFVHMLNGTAFAIGRTLVAIIENYQKPDGSIEVPKALRPFMGGLKVIK